jgi:hypothetical protein
VRRLPWRRTRLTTTDTHSGTAVPTAISGSTDRWNTQFPFCLSETRVHQYCSHLLAYCTSPGWQTVMIVEQLVVWMIGKGNRSIRRKTAPVPLCPPQTPHVTWSGIDAGRRCGMPASIRLSYGTVQHTDNIHHVANYHRFHSSPRNGWRSHDNREELASVRFEVFTAVTMKNGVFWNVTPCLV